MNFSQLDAWLVNIEGSDLADKILRNTKQFATISQIIVDHIDKASSSIILDCKFSMHSIRAGRREFNLSIPYPLPVDDYQSFYQLFLDCLSEQYPELLI